MGFWAFAKKETKERLSQGEITERVGEEMLEVVEKRRRDQCERFSAFGIPKSLEPPLS